MWVCVYLHFSSKDCWVSSKSCYEKGPILIANIEPTYYSSHFMFSLVQCLFKSLIVWDHHEYSGRRDLFWIGLFEYKFVSDVAAEGSCAINSLLPVAGITILVYRGAGMTNSHLLLLPWHIQGCFTLSWPFFFFFLFGHAACYIRPWSDVSQFSTPLSKNIFMYILKNIFIFA